MEISKELGYDVDKVAALQSEFWFRSLISIKRFIFFANNSTKIKEFNFEKLVWKDLPNPDKIFFPNKHRASPIDSGNRYLLTGGRIKETCLKNTLLFDNGKFSYLQDMLFSRYSHSSVFLDGL